MKTEERKILKMMQFLYEVDYENVCGFGVVITDEELSLHASVYFGWLDISYKDSTWLCKATSYADEIIYDLRFAENNVDALFAFLASYISPDNSEERNIEGFEGPDEMCDFDEVCNFDETRDLDEMCDFADELREITAVAKLRKAYLSFCGITNIQLQGLLALKGKEYSLVVEYNKMISDSLAISIDVGGLSIGLSKDLTKPFKAVDVLAGIIEVKEKCECYFTLCNSLRERVNLDFKLLGVLPEGYDYPRIIVETLVKVLAVEGEVVLPPSLINPRMYKQNKPIKIISPFGSLKNICPEHEGIEWIFEYSA